MTASRTDRMVARLRDLQISTRARTDQVAPTLLSFQKCSHRGLSSNRYRFARAHRLTFLMAENKRVASEFPA